jgi:hypothetical protein
VWCPGTDENGVDEFTKARRVGSPGQGFFGITPDPAPVVEPNLERPDQRQPKITPAEWEARDRPRQLLENIPVGRWTMARRSAAKPQRNGAESGPSH